MTGLRLATYALAMAGSLVQPGWASSCSIRRSACEAFAETDLLFVGRVESVEPNVGLLGMSPAARKFLQELRAKYSDFESDSPPLPVLKELYLKYLPARYRDQVSRANTDDDIGKITADVVRTGFRITLSMQKVFKGEKQPAIDVWTEMIGCDAYLMLPDETYLVYASTGDKGRLTVGGRTGRLSDVGDDLAYLHFVEYGGASSRFYGIVTSNESALKERPRRWREVPDPASSLRLLLENDSTGRMTETTEKGEFVFDGLPAGEYKLSLVVSSSLDDNDPALTRRVIVRERDCVSAELFVPKAALSRK